MTENMTKASFDAVMAKYGDKVCAIYIDNGAIIRLRYSGEYYDPESGWLTSANISTVTIGDTDFVEVKRRDLSLFIAWLSILFRLCKVSPFAMKNRKRLKSITRLRRKLKRWKYTIASIPLCCKNYIKREVKIPWQIILPIIQVIKLTKQLVML